MRHSLLAAAVLPLAVLPVRPACAQTPDHLVGVTRVTASLRHQDHANCARLAQCMPVGFPSAVGLGADAGATAWDPITGGAWITNGQVLAKVDDQCGYQCPPIALPMLGNSVAVGLEVVESARRMLLIDRAGFLHTFTLDCPPQHVGSCPLVGSVTALLTPTGLAVDEGLGLLFVALADFANDDNWIVVAPLNNACQIVQRIHVQPCPSPGPVRAFGAFTGLACDWGHRVLYATDGLDTMALRYTPAPTIGIAITAQSCCRLPVATVDPMIGLAVRPGRATSLGAGCSNGVCPPCPMRHELGNDPNVGNGAFHLELAGAPDGSLAWALIGLGPCSGPGLSTPPLCGPVLVGRFVGAIGPVPTGGGGGSVCTGGAAFRLGLPLLPALCGTVVSSQAAVLCASLTGQIGTSLSNCVTFVLQGS